MICPADQNTPQREVNWITQTFAEEIRYQDPQTRLPVTKITTTSKATCSYSGAASCRECIANTLYTTPQSKK